MYDVLIVGGGAAGLTAGLYASRAGLSAALVEMGFPGGQAATTNRLENYPGFPQGVGGPELMLAFQEQAEKFGLEIVYDRADALSLDGPVKSAMAGDRRIEARSAILALGASPRKLEVPGEEAHVGRGVSYCATCDGALYRGKRVAVVGGGDTAVEDAGFLSQLASQVFWLHRRSELRAVGGAAQRALARENVHPMFGKTVLAVEDGPEGALLLKLSDGGTLSVDGLFVAVGTRPMTDCVRGALALDAGGYIPAGEDTRTALGGVYAAGDCRAKPLRQVITAASDGAVAAFMAARDLAERPR